MSVNTNMDIFKNARIYVSRVFTELIRRKRKNLKIKRYETLLNPVTSQYSTNLLKYHDFTTTSTVSSKRSKQNAAHNFNLSPKYQKRDKRRYIQLQSRSTQKSFEFSASFLLINSFHFLTVLGRGQYGKVFLAHFRPTGRYYAVKAIKKEYLISSKTIQTVFTEKKIFEIIKSQRNKSPFLVKMFTCFQTVENIFFAIEYAGGGDLVTNLMKEKAYSEKRACFYAACITLALKFLHENLILYRDLKLDNCLIGLDGYLKITDFGISKLNFDYSDRTSTFCGTESYMAPEILLRLDYSRSVDWWALGVIVYEMILGQLPFSNRYQQITQAVYYPHKISRNSKDFIEKVGDLYFKVKTRFFRHVGNLEHSRLTPCR